MKHSTQRSYVMCRPEYFDVVYSVNPFMDTSIMVDKPLAQIQWQRLHETLLDLGHEVQVIEPISGQPDMVFTANAAVVIGDRGVSAHFRHPFRNPETRIYAKWLENHGIAMYTTNFISEGEGDFVVRPTAKGAATVFGGLGVRSEEGAHEELARVLEVRVDTLNLVDENFYHLDTALSFLDATTAVWVPEAFSTDSRAHLLSLDLELIPVCPADALALGANVVSDGYNVILERAATGVASSLQSAGFNPIAIDMSEFRKSGGAVRCCVLELY